MKIRLFGVVYMKYFMFYYSRLFPVPQFQIRFKTVPFISKVRFYFRALINKHV